MIVCPRCQHHNPETATVCASCGAPLERAAYRACPSCKALNPGTAVYCHRCFSPLDARVQATLDGAPPARPPARPSAVRREPSARPPIGTPRSPTGPAPSPSAPVPTKGGEPAPDQRPSASVPDAATRALMDAYAQADPIAFVRDALPLEPAALDLEGAVPSAVAPTAAELRAAELFLRIATEHAPLAEGKVRVVPERPRLLGRLARTILHVLVLAAALVPQFSGGWTSARVSPRPDVQALAAQLRALSPGQAVLVSFDYAGGSAGELEPVATELLGDLADRRVPFLLMSGSPAGLGLAQQALEKVEATRDAPLVYGDDYLLLGYLPGDAAGLRALATGIGGAFRTDAVQGRPLAEYPILATRAGLGGVRHVFVLADDATIARRWIEQVAAQSDAHYHAVVTARVEPLLVPYRETGQLATLVSGVAGATELAVAIDPRGAAPPLADGLAALTVLVGGVALAANVAPLLRRREGP